MEVQQMLWWLIEHSPFALIMSGVDELSFFWWRISDRLGSWLDRKLPRVRVHLASDSRLGRFLQRVTGFDNPAFCQAFWSTVSVPFRTRVAAGLGKIWLGLSLFIAVPICIWLAIDLALNYLRWAPVQVAAAGGGLLAAIVVASLLLAGAWALLTFIARYLCPVRFEINGNDVDNQAAA